MITLLPRTRGQGGPARRGGNGQHQPSVAALGQGGREQHAWGSYPTPLPSRVAWPSSGLPDGSPGHLCWSVPTRVSWPQLPAVLTELSADSGFPLSSRSRRPVLGSLCICSSLFDSLTAVSWLRLLRSPSCPFVPSSARPRCTHTHSSPRTRTSLPPTLVCEGRVRTIEPVPLLCELRGLGNEQPSPLCNSVPTDSCSRFLLAQFPVSVSPPSLFQALLACGHCLVLVVVPSLPHDHPLG